MIPYYPPPGPLLTSPITLEVFGLLVATGSILGYFIVVSRANLIGLPRSSVRAMGVWVLAFAFLVSFGFSALYEPAAMARDPSLLFRQSFGLSSFGGMLGGLLGAVYGARAYGGDWGQAFRLIDQTAYAFPFGWIFGRFGCFLAHDHRGQPSTSWIAVRFPDGPRLDLGFIEFLVTIAWVVTFLVLGRDRKPEFPWAAWTFALYGPFRVGLDQFRADRVHYGALTVDEWTGLAMGTLGWFTLWRVQRAGYSGAPREMR